MTRRSKSRAPSRKGGRRGGFVGGDESMATMYMSPYVRPTKDFDGPGVPNSQEVILRYAEIVTGSPASGVVSGNSYRLNGMFDPRVEAGGTQPTFFDQMTALYNNFCVTQCDIKVFVAPAGYAETSGTTNANVNSQAMAIIAPYGTGTIPSAATSDVMEWPGSQAVPMATQRSAVVSVKVLLHRAFGLSSEKMLLNNPNYWGSKTADPTTQWQAQAGVGSLSGALNTYAWDVRIRYKAVFFNPIFPAISMVKQICHRDVPHDEEGKAPLSRPLPDSFR